MSSAPSVAAYVIASLACSAITGTFMAGHLPPVVKQPAVQATLDRVGSALASRAVNAAMPQPDLIHSESSRGAAACDCRGDVDMAVVAVVEPYRLLLDRAQNEVLQWQCGTFVSIVVGVASWVWGVCSARKLQAKRAEQTRISMELSDLSSAISPARTFCP